MITGALLSIVLMAVKAAPWFADVAISSLQKKADNASEERRAELQRQIAIIEAQKQLGLAREGHFLGRLPVFLVAFSTGLYYSSVMLVSMIRVNEEGRWVPAELPSDFKVWVGIVIGGMFAIGASSMFTKR